MTESIAPLSGVVFELNLKIIYATVTGYGADSNGTLITYSQGRKAFELMLAVALYVDPICFEMDPISALDALASGAWDHLASTWIGTGW
jgi:hypothetical protein